MLDFFRGRDPFGVWSVERVVVSGFVRDVSSAKSLGVWRGFWGVPRVLTRPSAKNRSGGAFCGCLRGSFCPTGFGCSVGMLFRSFTRLTDCHGLGGI